MVRPLPGTGFTRGLVRVLLHPCSELPGSSQRLPEAPRGSFRLPEAPRFAQRLPEAAKCPQRLSEASSGCQLLPEAARSKGCLTHPLVLPHRPPSSRSRGHCRACKIPWAAGLRLPSPAVFESTDFYRLRDDCRAYVDRPNATSCVARPEGKPKQVREMLLITRCYIANAPEVSGALGQGKRP